MKKVLLVLAVCATATVFTSCKKECSCVTETAGLAGIASTVKTTKSCSSLNTSTTTNGVTVTLTCK